MSVDPRAEKFNIWRSDHGRIQKCSFSVLAQICSVRKVKIQWWCNIQNSMVMFTFFHIWLEIPFLGKFDPKNWNCQLKLKFGTYTNSIMQNSMVMFESLSVRWETPVLGKFGPKNVSFSLCWNLVPRLIWIFRIQ